MVKLRKTAQKKLDIFKGSEVVVVLEDIRDNIKILAEGQVGLRQELKGDVNNLRDELKDDISDLRSELKGDIAELREELRTFKQDTESNFKTVFDYLARIDKEIQEIKVELKNLKESKIDKESYFALEKRVLDLEKEVARLRARKKIRAR
ncbi:MAG: hypothetical protein PHT36_02770 [Patescibacteria group bacterium]|nr:hypothetical protein [Patescibacteria group bacterium]